MSYGDYLRNKYHHAAVKIADAEGVPCVLEYSKGKNIRNYEIYGNSVQDGTPSVDSPVEVQSVGDLTTKNLLPYPYPDTTKTINGITFTDNGDGTIAASGTATRNTQLRLMNWTTFDKTKKYYISGSPSGGGWSTHGIYIFFRLNGTLKKELLEKGNGLLLDLPNMTVEFNQIQINCVIWNGATVENITFKPQLELGSTATEYEPYHKYDVPITVTGKNLLKYPYYWTSRVRSGIMFTVNEDGTVTLNGTTTLTGTAIDDFTLAYETKIKSGTYTVSGCPEGGAAYKYRIFLHIRDSSGKSTYISDIGNGATFTVTSTSTMTASIRIGAEIGTVNNLVFAPQIELGSTATEYETYKGETTHIYLDEPLRKVENYADYIDFKNQKVVRNIHYTTISTVTAFSADKLYSTIPISGKPYPLKQIFDKLKYVARYDYVANSGFLGNNRTVYFNLSKKTSDYENKEEAQVELDSIGGFIMYYILETPTEESIALPALKTFKGKSIISADTTVLPSNIKVKYVRT